MVAPAVYPFAEHSDGVTGVRQAFGEPGQDGVEIKTGGLGVLPGRDQAGPGFGLGDLGGISIGEAAWVSAVQRWRRASRATVSYSAASCAIDPMR